MTIEINFTDYLKISKPNKKFVNQFKDYLASQAVDRKGLRVSLEATHAGVINRNNRFYIPSRMAEGVATFRTQEKPTKLMKHHNLEADPVGVIRSARFIPTVPDDLVDNPDVQNLMSSSAPMKDQLKSIRNLMRAGVFNRDGWRGLGYIELIGDVYDKKTIEQIQDGRLDAVSTFFRPTTGAHCLVCGKDWLNEGMCDHEYGDSYSEDGDEDGFKFPAIPIPANHNYIETSFVSLEGDALVTVDILDSINDNNNIKISIPNDSKWDDELNLTKPKFEFKDFKEDKMAKKKNNLSDAEKKIFDAIKKLRDNVEDDILMGFAKEISANFKDGLLPYQEEAEIDEDTAIRYSLEQLETKDSEIDKDKMKALYQDEFKAMKEEGKISEKQYEDAKATSENYDKLPKSAFCGKDNSFPAPDSLHVVAAKRFLDKYEGPGNKAEILANLNRKGKALGEDLEVEEVSENKDSKTNLLSLDEDSIKNMSDEDLRNLYMFAESQLVTRGQKMAYECKECAVNKTKVENAEKTVRESTDKLDKMQDTLNILREELARANADYVDQVDQYVDLGAKLYAEKVEKFAQIGVLSGKYDTLDNAKEEIRKDDIEKVSLQFADFDVLSVAKKFNDGMGNEPKGTVDDPTVNGDIDNFQFMDNLSGPAMSAVENIKALTKLGNKNEAKRIYDKMKSMKLFPDNLTFENLSAETKDKPVEQ